MDGCEDALQRHDVENVNIEESKRVPHRADGLEELLGELELRELRARGAGAGIRAACYKRL